MSYSRAVLGMALANIADLGRIQILTWQHWYCWWYGYEASAAAIRYVRRIIWLRIKRCWPWRLWFGPYPGAWER